jgi:hypothetical protein
MASWRRSVLCSTSGAGWPLAALLAVATQVACFKPNIKDGGLKCNLDAGVAKACPEGFKCDSMQNCVRNLDGGVDRADGSDATDATDASDTRPDGCFNPKPACVPSSGGLCDTFCQSGCTGCREKCSVNTVGTLTCNDIASTQQRGLMQPCQIQAGGTPNQVDPCLPGLVCLEDACGGGPGLGRCYQFCRSDMDCTNAPCNRDIAGGLKVCDVPYDDCVPLPASGNTGCMGSATACYLSTTDPSRTICDCEFPPGLGETDLCVRSRECNPGLVCVPDSLGNKVCTRVCRLGGPASDCFVGSCRVYMENGIANTTYGFCR